MADPVQQGTRKRAKKPRFVACSACNGRGDIPEWDGACECWMVFPCIRCDGSGEVRA